MRLTRLIENFLTFSRLERNRQHFEFTDVQPASVVDPATRAVHERFEQTGCHLTQKWRHDLPDIPADPDALVTVLINLLDNAYKYTRGKKFIVLRVFREGDSLHLRFATTASALRLANRNGSSNGSTRSIKGSLVRQVDAGWGWRLSTVLSGLMGGA